MFLDGSALPTLSALQRVLTADRIGRSVAAVVIRRGERIEVSVVPGEA